jgi:hypothetical protein
MTCQECELLLAGDEAAFVEDHLRVCAACQALHEELQANALALGALRDEDLAGTKVRPRHLPRKPLPWIAAAAAMLLLALIARQGLERRPPHPRQVTASVPVQAKLPGVPTPEATPVVRRKPKPARRSARPEQPLLVKMLTPDPDVVVYWIVD